MGWQDCLSVTHVSCSVVWARRQQLQHSVSSLHCTNICECKPTAAAPSTVTSTLLSTQPLQKKSFKQHRDSHTGAGSQEAPELVLSPARTSMPDLGNRVRETGRQPEHTLNEGRRDQGCCLLLVLWKLHVLLVQ